MTTIKVDCTKCQKENSFVSDDIWLRIYSKESGRYGFSCEHCGEDVTREADERVILLLLQGGVLPLPVYVPAEFLEAKTGPPLNEQDARSLHELLDSPDWFERLQDTS